ncbi:DNA mismatch repair endonuclease MutL [Halalkalirubrum salinum]|uniref:DNA mismatch repair endonuclease MutL n=1 Tax=Halalkalirubrum salinum TaxID=2563889 RepID=UPI0010FAF8BE|nr:DNA mismatch repair endonuclease MutL [Halalkalirubrum salinum]
MSDDRRSIEPLDQATVERIAAGEVVERPASVVKELVENSLDAGASRISVAVKSGGTDGIRVADDGAGIPRAELSIAVEPHTTSKIRAIDDLESGVASLGFRGEALSTIAAVSKLTLRSKPEAQPVGAELRVEGGDADEPRPVGCPTGTTIEVEELFYNTPARRKFLKRDATEFDHVQTVVTQYALANPDVAFALEHDGRERFATEGNGDLRSAILAVYGRTVAESMIEIDETPDSGPIKRIHGLVSHPETNRSTREYLATFVNDRYVTAATLREAVVDAYGGQLAADRYPFAVLFVSVPPASVDVNVHPRKLEVRFDEEEAVSKTVQAAVAESLVDAGLIRSSAPRGRSAPAETEIEPATSEEPVVGGSAVDTARDHNEAPEEDDRQRPTAEPADRQRPTAEPADRQRPTAEPADRQSTTAEPIDPESAQAWTVDGLGGEEAAEERKQAEQKSTNPKKDALPDETVRDETQARSTDAAPTQDRSPTETTDSSESTAALTAPTTSETDTAASVTDTTQSVTNTAASQPDETTDPSRHAAIADTGTQRTLDGDDATAARTYDALPSLRVLGQLYDTYVVAESEDGLVLIDQHAADERVHYERLQAAFAADGTAQALATPVELELTAREAALFDEHRASIAELGFAAERIDDRWLRVGQVPAILDATVEPEILRDVLVSLVTAADGGTETIDDVADELLADLACHPSVTGNTSLTEGSIVGLLEALDGCENPYECPHGRPTVIRFDRPAIEDRFERDYPGHADQRRSE